MDESTTRKARQSRLREFYGIDEEEEKKPVERYYEELLKTQNLPDLIKSDNTMIAEIKKLDIDMKTLVYENYNKFISATDTIRKMKSNVENMEDEMNRLSENMAKISTCSNQINSTLSVRREKIEQLSGVHRLLKKLQFLVELPSRLRRSIQLEAYSQAVRYFNKTSGILKRYDEPSFQAIQKECELIIDELKIKLRDRMKDPVNSAALASEAAHLLLELREPPKSLRDVFLKSRRLNLEEKIHSLSKKPEQLSTPDYLTLLNKAFLSEFLESSRTFRVQFVERQQAGTEQKDSSAQLDTFTKEFLTRYFTIIRNAISENKDTTELINSLTILYEELNSAHSQLPFLAISDKAADLINGTVQSQIEGLFATLQTNSRELIRKMAISANAVQIKKSGAPVEAQTQPGGVIPQNLAGICKSTSFYVIADIIDLLAKLTLFLTNKAEFLTKHLNTFMAKIHVMCEQFFLLLNMHILEFNEDEMKNSPEAKEILTPRFILLLSRLCLHIEAETIPQVSSMLAKLRQDVDPRNAALYSVNVSELQSNFKTSAQRMLSYYVRLQSLKISQMIWKGIDSPANWLKMKEPKAPRPVTDLIIEEIKHIDAEVHEAFERLEERTNAEISRSRSKRDNKKLFERKVPLFQEVEFNRASTVLEVIKVSMKSYLEFVRLKTFGKNGLQQMQMDVFFIKRSLAYYAKGSDNPITTLLNEVMISTEERCLEPVLMDANMVVQICEAKFVKNQAPAAEIKSSS